MTEALSVLRDPILPVFAIMFFGWALGRAGRMSVEDARTINRFAMSVLVPILTFDLLATADPRSFSLLPVLAYAGAEAVVFAAGFVLARHVLGHGAREAVLLSFCGIFANNVFFGLPITRLIHGPDSVMPVTAVITLDSTLAFGGAMMALQLMERGRISPGVVVGTVARTPLLVAILAGGAFAATGLGMPAPVRTFLDFNGGATAPVALFALGVVLSRTAIRPDATVAAFAAIKLAVFPAAVWLGTAALAAADPQRPLWLLAAAGPSGAMGFSLALLHGVRTDTIARIIIWTSALSLFTLAVLA